MTKTSTIKPGYRTTEWWVTLASFVFSGLFLFGAISNNDQKDELIDISGHVIESCILIVGQLAVFYRYVSSRAKLKQKAEDNKKLELESHEQKRAKTNGRSTPTKSKPRPTKSGTRKTTRKPKDES